MSRLEQVETTQVTYRLITYTTLPLIITRFPSIVAKTISFGEGEGVGKKIRKKEEKGGGGGWEEEKKERIKGDGKREG